MRTHRLAVRTPTPARTPAVAILLLLLLVQAAAPRLALAQSLPERLSDAEFWRIVTDISEPGGYFRLTDNFTSNEMEVAQVASMLKDRGISGGAYIGVGPEQNFTYIATARPAVAFVIDIRRQAVIQHLMFKALFELSRDRSEFISLLFSRSRPSGLDSNTSIKKVWTAFNAVQADSALATRTRNRVFDHLLRTHKFALTDEEGLMLNWVLEAFTRYGPTITTTAGQGGRGGSRGNFMTLTGHATDTSGTVRSFLSTEENFRFVKNLQERNLIIPVSGDFAGPKALRGIGTWLTRHSVTVSAFYLSNVEQYLFQDQKHSAFYTNVATLPTTEQSVFIRPYALRGRGFGIGATSALRPLCPIRSYLKAVDAGRIQSNVDALNCVQQ